MIRNDEDFRQIFEDYNRSVLELQKEKERLNDQNDALKHFKRGDDTGAAAGLVANDLEVEKKNCEERKKDAQEDAAKKMEETIKKKEEEFQKIQDANLDILLDASKEGKWEEGKDLIKAAKGEKDNKLGSVLVELVILVT